MGEKLSTPVFLMPAVPGEHCRTVCWRWKAKHSSLSCSVRHREGLTWVCDSGTLSPCATQAQLPSQCGSASVVVLGSSCTGAMALLGDSGFHLLVHVGDCESLQGRTSLLQKSWKKRKINLLGIN